MWLLKLILIVGMNHVETTVPFETKNDCAQSLILHEQAADILGHFGLHFDVAGKCIREEQA